MPLFKSRTFLVNGVNCTELFGLSIAVSNSSNVFCKSDRISELAIVASFNSEIKLSIVCFASGVNSKDDKIFPK